MKYKLPIILLLLFFSFNASAYDFKVDNIYYNVLSLEKMIVETTGMLNNYSGDVVIPETVEYKGRTFKVVAIGDATFNRCADLNSVTIPSSITIIKDAFEGCSLEEIIMPNSVEEIAPGLFMDCTKLKYIKWSENIKEIPRYACMGCSSLKNVTIPSNIMSVDESAFYKCGIEHIEIEDGENILKMHTGVFSQVVENISLHLGRNIEAFDYNGTSTQKVFWGIKKLSVGPNVTQIPVINGGLDSITLYCTNPPKAPSYSYSGYMDIKVLVPKGTLSIYKSVEPWKNFWDISEMDDITGINKTIVKAPFSVMTNGNTVWVKGTEHSKVLLYNALGILIDKGKINGGAVTFSTNENFVMVKVDGCTTKVLLR